MRRLASVLLWGGISALGATGFGVLALSRGETVNAAWLLVAAVCTYAVAYRFYSRFLAARVFGLDERRATPAERFNNGRSEERRVGKEWRSRGSPYQYRRS